MPFKFLHIAFCAMQTWFSNGKCKKTQNRETIKLKKTEGKIKQLFPLMSIVRCLYYQVIFSLWRQMLFCYHLEYFWNQISIPEEGDMCNTFLANFGQKWRKEFLQTLNYLKYFKMLYCVNKKDIVNNNNNNNNNSNPPRPGNTGLMSSGG